MKAILSILCNNMGASMGNLLTLILFYYFCSLNKIHEDIL